MSELILKKKSDFLPPPEGVHNAVCVDVVDLGLVEVTWKGKTKKSHKVRITWEIDQEMPEGKGRFIAMNRYTFSNDKKSNLRKMLKSWRGRDFTNEEMASFNLEVIIGVPCQLVITHNEKDGTIYANVESVIKAGKEKLSASGKYKRVKDRDGYVAPGMEAEGVQESPEESNEDDEQIPF